MSVLEKAKLQEISSVENAEPVGDPVEVQLNPTSLRLQLNNQVEGGRSLGRPKRQFIGVSAVVLGVELVFDTADEGTTGAPRSVREKTAAVERYLQPREEGGQTPPALRFQWGELIVDGIVESLTLELDHFAAEGVPLRATVGLSLSGQEPQFAYRELGGGPGGHAGLGRVAAALGGETAAEFAARMGLDPAAWRGLDADLGAALELPAGVEVGFDPAFGTAAGLALQPGFAAGIGPPGMAAAAPPPADARAATYGFGVPLRPRAAVPPRRKGGRR